MIEVEDEVKERVRVARLDVKFAAAELEDKLGEFERAAWKMVEVLEAEEKAIEALRRTVAGSGTDRP